MNRLVESISRFRSLAESQGDKATRAFWDHVKRTGPPMSDPEWIRDEGWWDDYMAKDKRAYQQARKLKEKMHQATGQRHY